MAFLRLKKLTNSNATTLIATFTSDVATNIDINNFSVESTYVNINDLTVKSISISDNKVTIITSPQFSDARYKFSVFGIITQQFTDTNGNLLLEDDHTNVVYFNGQIEENEVRTDSIDELSSIYDFDNPTTTNALLTSLAKEYNKNRIIAKEIGNDNYLSVAVTDEEHIRGSGSFDKLDNEQAYELIRVSKLESGSQLRASLVFSEEPDGYGFLGGFPEEIVNLQATSITEEETTNFDGRLISISNQPISKALAISLIRDGTTYIYPILTFGYTIKNNRYDTLYARSFVTLEENQILLSSAATDFPTPAPGDMVIVSYEYDNNGIKIIEDTLVVTEIINIEDEIIPPNTTIFILDQFPIVDLNGNVPTLGGVSFSGNSAVFSTEISHSDIRIPSVDGEYSINYETGLVRVASGTDAIPILATYKYRKTYVRDLDYSFDEDAGELAAFSTRAMIGRSVKVVYNYEQNFRENSDFIFASHVEETNERVENRLLSEFAIISEKAPIINVFKVFNETTGEIYVLDRFTDNVISFTGNIAPRTKDITRELASFARVDDEIINVVEIFTNINSIRTFKISLANNKILNANLDNIGNNINTSLSFVNDKIFVTELFYDPDLFTELQNYSRITSLGQYVVDYENGNLFVGVSSSQVIDVGTVGYNHAQINTAFEHILKANDIYKSITSAETEHPKVYTAGQIFDSNFTIIDLESAERFINNNSSLPLFVTETAISKTITVSKTIKNIRGIYKLVELNSGTYKPLKNYFTEDTTFSDNIITLESGTLLEGSDEVVIDYSFGEIYIDYNYLMDNLLISYEWGNNSLDFSTGTSVLEGQTYFVSYRYGALRGALAANFGAITNQALLSNVDETFDRETYRDFLKGFISSMVQGPTIPSIKRFVQEVSKVSPDITELAFNNWELGVDPLFLSMAEGALEYSVGKFENGYLSNENSFVSLKAASNIRIEEGTLETYVVPDWDGIDNDATLTFSLFWNNKTPIDYDYTEVGFESASLPNDVSFSWIASNNYGADFGETILNNNKTVSIKDKENILKTQDQGLQYYWFRKESALDNINDIQMDFSFKVNSFSNSGSGIVDTGVGITIYDTQKEINIRAVLDNGVRKIRLKIQGEDMLFPVDWSNWNQFRINRYPSSELIQLYVNVFDHPVIQANYNQLPELAGDITSTIAFGSFGEYYWAESDWDYIRYRFEDLFRLQNIYLGKSANNPTATSFEVNKDSADINGCPSNFNNANIFGYFIWYDEIAKRWQMQWKQDRKEKEVAEYENIDWDYNADVLPENFSLPFSFFNNTANANIFGGILSIVTTSSPITHYSPYWTLTDEIISAEKYNLISEMQISLASDGYGDGYGVDTSTLTLPLIHQNTFNSYDIFIMHAYDGRIGFRVIPVTVLEDEEIVAGIVIVGGQNYDEPIFEFIRHDWRVSGFNTYKIEVDKTQDLINFYIDNAIKASSLYSDYINEGDILPFVGFSASYVNDHDNEVDVSKFQLVTENIGELLDRFSGTIETSGQFSDVTKINMEQNDSLTTTDKKIEFDAYMDKVEYDGYDGYDGYIDGYSVFVSGEDGLSWTSDDFHYLFDLAYANDNNRMSIYRDGKGFIRFKILDRMGRTIDSVNEFILSKNIKTWLAGELHFVTTTWRTNTAEERDEMHLFVDGEEVPNLYKYGAPPLLAPGVKFSDVAEHYINVVFSGSDAAATIINFDIDLIKFAIFKIKDGITTELRGRRVNEDGIRISGQSPDAEEYDYIIVTERGADNYGVINFESGVLEIGDVVFLRTYGLTSRRITETVGVYGNNSGTIKTNAVEPVSLDDIEIIPMILDTALMGYTGTQLLVSMLLGSETIYILKNIFIPDIQPFDDTRGRRLEIDISADNSSFIIPGYVEIVGLIWNDSLNMAVNGSELVPFTQSGTIFTNNYFTHINYVRTSFPPTIIDEPVGTITVKENESITISQNDGNAVTVSDFANGFFYLDSIGYDGYDGYTFGLNGGKYIIKYSAYLSLKIDRTADKYFIGSDFNCENTFNGIIDEFRLLDEMRTDTRTGETINVIESITQDYRRNREFRKDINTLALMHFNDTLENDSDYYNSYNSYLQSSTSVNSSFGSSINLSLLNRPHVIENVGILNNNTGTIEFWISPLREIRNDPVERYYMDVYGATTERVTSLTNKTLELSRGATRILSVRLLSDKFGTGVDYFEGGRIRSNGTTVLLGKTLPGYNLSVDVTYLPSTFTGNRLRLYKDVSGYFNFSIITADSDFTISANINSWNRNTWHKIFVNWDINNVNNIDQMRLLIDGVERGTARYGSGATIIGQETPTNGLLRSDISFVDTLPTIYVGTDFLGNNVATARMDNLRFSSSARKVTFVGGFATDVQYSSSAVATRMVEDIYTTYLEDFEGSGEKFVRFSNLVNSISGIYGFDVNVIDSFDKIIGINNMEDLVGTLLGALKPAHSNLAITFVE